MRRQGLGLWLGLLGAVALSAPAVAAAAPSPHRPDREVQQPMSGGIAYLGEVDGYEIAIASRGAHAVILYVDRLVQGGDGRGTTYTATAYAVRPQRSIAGGTVRADFGWLGKVDLRFRPSGKTRTGHVGKHCRGRSPVLEDGQYRGKVSLRGNDDYFQLQAHGATGYRTRSFRLSCAQGQAHKDRAEPLYQYVAPSEGFFAGSAGGSIALILAVSRYGGRFVYLRAAHMQSEGPGAEVQASALELEPHMAISHDAFADGGEGTLLSSLPGEHPATATLAPPDPFHGEAHLVASSSTSHSWKGTLGVSFPGLDLPLVGPTYATSLCVSSPFKTPAPCDFRRLPRVPE